MSQQFPELEIKFLPPYSPFLNPIENSFSVVKQAIKRYLHYCAEHNSASQASAAGTSQLQVWEMMLQAVIEDAVPSLTRDVLAAQYTLANSYSTRCIQLEDIFN